MSILFFLTKLYTSDKILWLVEVNCYGNLSVKIDHNKQLGGDLRKLLPYLKVALQIGKAVLLGVGLVALLIMFIIMH